MPPIDERGHDHDQGDDEDDNDGLPPLVDNPTTNPPITYTFYSEMTPASFSTSSSPAVATFQHPPDSQLSHSPQTPQPPPEQPIASSSSTITIAPPRSSHGKKRDASYIPRPPNAFILYRSSFIRSQQVTDKVEGNHSNLSKIIGKYWKTLPQAERDEWEAKAVLAQAEHRARYPDWRFRPGANALAKLKAGASADARTKGGGITRSRPTVREKGKAKEVMKDKKGKKKAPSDGDVSVDVETETGNGSGHSKRRRVNTRTKNSTRSRSGSGLGLDIENEDRGDDASDGDDAYEPPTEEPKRKRGRGASIARSLTTAGTDTTKTAMDTRCAKIVDLLGEGKTGVALEVAVKEWEGGRKRVQKQNHSEESIPVQDIGAKDTGAKDPEKTEGNATMRVEGEMRGSSATSAVPQGISNAPNINHPIKNPPHILIPSYGQPSPTSVPMFSPTRSPTSSYTQPPSPYTQSASPHVRTSTSLSPYTQTASSPYSISESTNSQHSRSKSLYGRFPAHEAAHVSVNGASSLMQSALSQTHPPTYLRAARSHPGAGRSPTQQSPSAQNGIDPQPQDNPHPLNFTSSTADALVRGEPLTQLFKRSLSAPASDNRSTYPPAHDTGVAAGHTVSNVEDSERGEIGDGPVEPPRGTLNQMFPLNNDEKYSSFPPTQTHVDSGPSAHPQHVYTSSHQNTYPISHPPAFSPAHEPQQHAPPHSTRDTQYQQQDVQQESPKPNQEATAPPNPPALTWMDEEYRRRLEAAREHGYWWDGNEQVDDGVDTVADGVIDEVVGDEELGYEDASNEEFDTAYSQHYSGSGNHTRDDGRSGWTRVAGRQGLIVALEDPYLRRKSRSRSTTPPSKPQPLPPLPIPAGELPLSEALRTADRYGQEYHPFPSAQHQLESQNLPPNDYFTPYHSISTVIPVPKSSFSTLTGWDGGSGSQERKIISRSGWEMGVWGTNKRIDSTASKGDVTGRGREPTREGRQVMFSVAEEDEAGYGYGYKMGEMGMGTEMGGTDRGTGMLYDDGDDRSDMVVGSPSGGQ